jgi:hypothetical protein
VVSRSDRAARSRLHGPVKAQFTVHSSQFTVRRSPMASGAASAHR